MHRRINSFLTLSLFLLSIFTSTSVAQTPLERGLNSIERDYAESIIGFLSSDALRGRKAGSNEAQIAAEHLASCLKQLGVAPYDGSFIKEFTVYENVEQWRYQFEKPPLEKGETSYPEISLSNVIGVIEGRRKDEFVVVGAHYDHLGVDPFSTTDSIYNGADDNASGVSAVLQLARAMMMSGQEQERTVIFAFWDAEELGFLGSKYFVENLIDPGKIKAYLNFDMIGRNHDESQPTQFQFIYTASCPFFQDFLLNDIDSYQLNLRPFFIPKEKPLDGSDNVSFARYDIPIIWYHTDGHPDYHQTTDHMEKLNWSKMIDITKSGFLILWRLAGMDFMLPDSVQ